MADQQPSLFEGVRTCRVCSETKEIVEFRLVKNRNRVYRSNRCLSCEKEWMRNYAASPAIRQRQNDAMRKFRRENPEAARAHGRKWAKYTRDKNMRTVYEAYGNKCQCCGEDNPLFLSVDHVNNDGYLERKAHTQGNLYSRIIRAGFPDTYQLLCFNCNMAKRRNNGVCPHQEGSTVIAQASSSERSEAPGSLSLIRDDDMTSPSAQS